MSPCPNRTAGTQAKIELAGGAHPPRRTRIAAKSDSGLFSYAKVDAAEELWTSRPLPVDGLRGRLRQIPQITSLDPRRLAVTPWDCSWQRRIGRASACRVCSNQIFNGKGKVETACPCSKALSIPGINPLAVVEDIAADNNWSFERSGEDEVTIVSKGDWTDYQLSFTWMSEIEALHLACAFDMKIPQAAPRRGAAADRRHQRAIMDRAFRHLDPHRHDHAPPGAGAAGRADRLDRAMREHAGRRHPRLRALLSGVPVRGLGRQDQRPRP